MTVLGALTIKVSYPTKVLQCGPRKIMEKCFSKTRFTSVLTHNIVISSKHIIVMMLTLAPTVPTLFDGSLGQIPLDQLPAEILLDIIPHIPFSPHNLSCLCLTCTKLNGLIKAHERSLVAQIKHCQFCTHTLGLFPGLQPETFSDLGILHRRLETLDDLHSKWLRIVNHGIELQWLKGRWENIHKAGLLLLYRIYDTPSYADKIELMQSLPATSLACLLFKLISSIKILRIYGPEPINARFAQGDTGTRADVELAFEELLLQHGPEFFIAMLKETDSTARIDAPLSQNPLHFSSSRSCRCTTQPTPSNHDTAWAIRYVTPSFHRHFPRLSRAEFESWLLHLTDTRPVRLSHRRTLKTEIDSMYARQQPFPDGTPKPPTLIASLRRALAMQAGCEIGQTVTKMWEILSGPAFDRVDQHMLGDVVRGVAVTPGARRMGL